MCIDILALECIKLLAHVSMLDEILFLGAKGYFEVTHDVTKYCKASIFDQIGKKTPLAVRFSTVGEFF